MYTNENNYANAGQSYGNGQGVVQQPKAYKVPVYATTETFGTLCGLKQKTNQDGTHEYVLLNKERQTFIVTIAFNDKTKSADRVTHFIDFALPLAVAKALKEEGFDIGDAKNRGTLVKPTFRLNMESTIYDLQDLRIMYKNGEKWETTEPLARVHRQKVAASGQVQGQPQQTTQRYAQPQQARPVVQQPYAAPQPQVAPQAPVAQARPQVVQQPRPIQQQPYAAPYGAQYAQPQQPSFETYEISDDELPF